ncbi:MAG: D-2-hydroxyacid dehydrogenase family protein [Proteobacteria bacterium]|nr:D-2-hydroxyacid dehydrogenase family protein [Burkholderiales bacterium]
MQIAIPHDHQDLVRRLGVFSKLAGHDVRVFTHSPTDPVALAEQLEGAQALVLIRERTPVTAALLERLPALEVVSQLARTTHHIDIAACTAHRVAVVTGNSKSPVSPAEHTFALILASARAIPLEAGRMQRGEEPTTLGFTLRGKTLALLGFGTIAGLVAQMGHGFGMRVIAHGRAGSKERATAAGIEFIDERARFLREADVLSLHLRLTPQTRSSVTASDLASMKPTALIVNTARAELIEPRALEGALRAGRPGYAAVDVFEVEPVPVDHPLLKMPNVVCTPHYGWATHETYEQYFGEAFDNVVAYAAGQPLDLVNPEVRDTPRPAR